MKRARKRQIKLFVQRRTTFAEALMRMPNVGMDADFERVDTVDKMLQFMRDARPMTTSLDLKQSKDESRA